MRKNPILVTGSHRSGTTWVGKMLALSWYTFYFEEPFNPFYARISQDLIPHEFYYVRRGSEAQLLEAALRQLLANYKSSAHSGFRYRFNRQIPVFRQTRRFFGWPRPLMKDPVAVFSTEWLAQTFNMDVICLIRHPAAFVTSLIKAKWPADFAPLLMQTELMEDFLYPFRSQMEQPPDLFVERAALMWTVIYYVLSIYIDRHEDWLIMRLEDLANDPVPGFAHIFNYLELPYSRRIQHCIKEHSDPNNRVEAPEGNTWEIRRNSRAAQKVWCQKLKPEEIDAIRCMAEPVSSRFYSDVDWKVS